VGDFSAPFGALPLTSVEMTYLLRGHSDMTANFLRGYADIAPFYKRYGNFDFSSCRIFYLLSFARYFLPFVC
jgi:hypothetical protein